VDSILIGQDITATSSLGANVVSYMKMTALYNGELTSVSFYSTTVGSLKFALYTDIGGAPGVRVYHNSAGVTTVANQWNTYSIDPTWILAGTNYWLGTITNTTGTGKVNTSYGTRKRKSMTYIGYIFPESADTGLSDDTVTPRFLGMGEIETCICGISLCTSDIYGEIVNLVKVSYADMLEINKLRIYFDDKMKKDSNLSNAIYYSILPITPGAVTPYISEILLPDVNNPVYVDLITSEMTDAATYQVIVSAYGPTSINDLRIDEYYNSKTFLAIGNIPTIKQIVVVSSNRIDVVFTEIMKYNSAIKNPTKYTFNNGLLVLSVLEVDSDTVKLVTSEQTTGVLYTLTVNP
jgi:hypothetical protein